MAGDHCQLPPTIKSMEAAKKGLSETLFEKCIQRSKVDVLLKIQYRMHKNIMTFSSNKFYYGALDADVSVKEKKLIDDDNPVIFIDTAGCGFTEQINPENKSIENKEEGLLLLKHLKEYLQLIGYRRIMEENLQIGIISPYKAQVMHLQDEINQDFDLQSFQSQMSVDTVDAFQGRERDIIYISLVRSNEDGEIGFLKDIRRMNVAMTRAKMKLVIFGDSSTLGSFPFYDQLIDYVNSINSYKSAYEIIYSY